MSDSKPAPGLDFVRAIVARDNETGKWDGRVITRFPPEPNGYLHIGHAKSIVLNFGVAQENGGTCHLRFDDTNPIKEEQEYIDSIKSDVRWLGFDWGEHEYYASDYFEQLYEWAVQLIKAGKAFVCELNAEQMREYRGTLTEPGKNSPWRDRPVEENLDLFERMKAGEFDEGSHTLRARVDMAHPNLNMRDPVMYRILKASHHRTGDKWCIYPMYDFTHGQSDSIERHHPLDLHPRVRGPPAALRLVPGHAGHLSPAADRVRPAQPDLYPAQQAPPDRAGQREDW